MSEEHWLPVVGYEGAYEVSSRGNVRGVDRLNASGRSWRGKLLKVRKDRHGYWRACLTKNGKKTRFLCHRLVLIAFGGPPPFDGAEAAHLDGNRTNNTPQNLIWATRKENAAHMKLHGTSNGAVGECNASAKLTVESVRRIREARLFGATTRDMAVIYGMTDGGIRGVLTGGTWTHVPMAGAWRPVPRAARSLRCQDTGRWVRR
jgi:hypothetical protein